MTKIIGATTAIRVSECYTLHIHTSRVLDTSAKHLSISSTFTGAKDPHDQRKLFDVTLEPRQYNQLVNAIKETP